MKLDLRPVWLRRLARCLWCHHAGRSRLGCFLRYRLGLACREPVELLDRGRR